jgi:hypothetical protein
MTDMESARTQLLAMAALPEVADLAAIVSNIALQLDVRQEAGDLTRLLQGEGSCFVELLEAQLLEKAIAGQRSRRPVEIFHPPPPLRDQVGRRH